MIYAQLFRSCHVDFRFVPQLNEMISSGIGSGFSLQYILVVDIFRQVVLGCGMSRDFGFGKCMCVAFVAFRLCHMILNLLSWAY